MNLEDAIKKIVSHYNELLKNQEAGYSTPKIEAVWCGKSDTAGSYEVDEEWIGVRLDGSIAWAYASSCSCWDGNFEEERFASIKEVILSHKQHLPEDWGKAIIRFAETNVMQDLTEPSK